MLLDKAVKAIHLDVVGKGPYLWELTWKTQEVIVSFMCADSSQQSHFRGNTHMSCKVGSSKEPDGSPTFLGILKVELIDLFASVWGRIRLIKKKVLPNKQMYLMHVKHLLNTEHCVMYFPCICSFNTHLRACMRCLLLFSPFPYEKTKVQKVK